jgi:hypothetical protein
MAPAAVQATHGIAWVALAVWVVTAAVGASMVIIWLARGGPRQLRQARRLRQGRARLRPALFVTHLLLAVTALGVWVAYLVLADRVLARIALGLLAVVAGLGAASFTIWQRRRLGVLKATEDSWDLPPVLLSEEHIPAEQHFPAAVVALHGVLAIGTVATVALLALGVVAKEPARHRVAPARVVAVAPPPPPALPPPPTPAAAPTGSERGVAARSRFRLRVAPGCVPRSGRLKAGLIVRPRRRARVRVVFVARPGRSRRVARDRPYRASLRVTRGAHWATVLARIAARRRHAGARVQRLALSRRLTACA